MEDSSGEDAERSYRNPSPPALAAEEAARVQMQFSAAVASAQRRTSFPDDLPTNTPSPAAIEAAMAAAEAEVPGCVREGIGGTVLTKLWVLDLLVRTVEYARSEAKNQVPRAVVVQGSCPDTVADGGPDAEFGGQQGPGAGAGAEAGHGDSEATGLQVPPALEAGAGARDCEDPTERPTTGADVTYGSGEGWAEGKDLALQGAVAESEDAGKNGVTCDDEPKGASTESEGSNCARNGLLQPVEAPLKAEPVCAEKKGLELKTEETAVEGPVTGQQGEGELAEQLEQGLEEGMAQRQLLSGASPYCSTEEHGGGSSSSSSNRHSYVSDGYISGSEEKMADMSTDSGMDADLEEELCILWDASMIYDVAEFLYRNGSADCLLELAEGTAITRLKEICIGVVANMSCFPHVCQGVFCRKETVDQVMVFLESEDSRVLTETTRCIASCLGHQETKPFWLDFIKSESETFLRLFSFFLKSSTNDDLLKHAATLLDAILCSSVELLQAWSRDSLVEAICEAIQQTSTSTPSISASLLLSLQQLSTIEAGVSCLVSLQSRVVTLSLHYLCTLDHVDSSNHLSALAAASLLGVVRDHTHHRQELCLDQECRTLLGRLLAEVRVMEASQDMRDLSTILSLKRLLKSLLDHLDNRGDS